MEIVLALALDHWIIAGWIVWAIMAVISQNESIIDSAVKHKADGVAYDIFTAIIVGGVMLWGVISVIAVIKWAWFTV